MLCCKQTAVLIYAESRVFTFPGISGNLEMSGNLAKVSVKSGKGPKSEKI